uniref:Xenotropic and polytropic retrovirus receptor 1 homolog (Trinotate prediction) n=1 Tax=Myxobolus squamalis TaxID=59785 RepID=A0A6B2G3N1_MYXSQ
MMLAGQLMVILYVVGFGINLFGWSRSSVNHVLVFEIDPRNHINFIQCFLVGFVMLAIWFSSVLAYITLEKFAYILPFIPFVSFLIFFIIFINPFEFFFRSSRFWAGRLIVFVCFYPRFQIF